MVLERWHVVCSKMRILFWSRGILYTLIWIHYIKINIKSFLWSFFIKHFNSHSLYFSFHVPMCQMYVVTTTNQLFMLVVLTCLSLICTDYFKFGTLYYLQSCHWSSMSFLSHLLIHLLYTLHCKNNNSNSSLVTNRLEKSGTSV